MNKTKYIEEIVVALLGIPYIHILKYLSVLFLSKYVLTICNICTYSEKKKGGLRLTLGLTDTAIEGLSRI